jgi:hypothetical protein
MSGPGYPISSEELTRRILGHDHEPEYGRFLQGKVRPLLRKFKCPKASSMPRSQYLIYEDMERKVSDAFQLTHYRATRCLADRRPHSAGGPLSEFFGRL